MSEVKTIIERLRAVNAQIFVDGDNMRIDAQKETIDGPLKELIRTNKKDLIAYVKKIRHNGDNLTIPQIPLQASYVLSSSQQRLWIISQFEQSNIAYNMPGVFIFEGELDHTSLKYCFQLLVQKHEILRTVFRQDEQGQVRQVIISPHETGFNIFYS